MAHALVPADDDGFEQFQLATLRGVNKSTIALNKPTITVGRARECDVCIAESFLSRRHAVFTYVNNAWHIESLGANGVSVNFKNIPAHKQVPLSDKDNIEFCRGSGFKYVFRTSVPTQCVPSAAKRLRTANEPLAAEDECSSNLQQLLATLRSQEALCRKAVAENEALKAEKEHLLSENNILKNEKEELLLKLQEEACRPREPPASGNGTELPAAISLQQLEVVLEQDATCSICCELFVSAVTLSCRHTFCTFCREQWYSKCPVSGFQCPICRALTRFQVETPVVDSVIDSLVQCMGVDAQQQRRDLIAQRNLAKAHGAGPNPSGNKDRIGVQRMGNSARASGAVAQGSQPGHRPSPRRPAHLRPGVNRSTPGTAGHRRGRALVITIDGSQAGNVQNDLSDSDDDIVSVGGHENPEGDDTSTSSISGEDDEDSAESDSDSSSSANSDDSYDEGLPGYFYGGYGRCFSCGRHGHWAPGCPF